MAISPPRWASNAIPTSRGWVVGKELVKAQRFTPNQIAEFYGKPEPEQVTPVAEPVLQAPENPVVIMDDEPVRLVPDFNSMLKADLIKYANDNEIEIDPTSLKTEILATINREVGL